MTGDLLLSLSQASQWTTVDEIIGIIGFTTNEYVRTWTEFAIELRTSGGARRKYLMPTPPGFSFSFLPFDNRGRLVG